MLKKFNMLALIVLLIFQTMITPVAATAQGVEQEADNTITTEDVGSTDEVDASEETESTETEDTDVDEEGSNAGEISEEDPESEEDTDVNEEESEEGPEGNDQSDEKSEVTGKNEGAENTSANRMITTLQAKDLGDIFSFGSLKIDGTDINDGDVIVIGEDTVAQLNFSWNTEGRNAKAGDTASIRLSDAFEIVTTSGQPILVEGINVGTYHIENGVLIFEFNEGIEESDVQNGFVDLGLEFNLEKFRENIEQEIPFHDGSDQNITVIAKPNLEHSGIDKEGHPDTGHDAREITWKIDVINTNDEEITGATLADNIPDGLGEARDFVIHELSVGFDGDIREGADVTSTLNPSVFPIDLGTVAPFNGYRVQYTTTIENYAADSFTNEATFEYGDTSLPADVTVGGLTRSNPIEKDGWQVGNDDVIQWHIDVNKNGSLISEAIVADELPDGLTIDSIEVVRITQSGGNWVEEEGSSDDSFTVFPINLGALGQEDAYRIKFTTDVDWSAVNEGEYLKDNGFLNEATLYDGEDELNDDDASVTIVRDPIIRKVGASNVDYNNKTVTWTIHVNEAGHPIGNVVLTDLIPDGLAITEGDINITDEEENDYLPDSVNLDPNAAGGTEVVIDLGDVGTRQLKVEYTTEITDFTINNFNNGVGMIGDGIGPDGENSNAEIRPAGNTYGKSFAGIDYNEKTIGWKLNVDPRREAIDSLTIEDTFPNKGLILLPDTVEVKFAGVDLDKGTDYTLVPRTDGETGYHKGFIITLLDHALPLDGDQLVVDYQTSYDPQLVIEGHTLDPHEPNVGDDTNNTDRLYVNSVRYTGETVNENGIEVTRNASQRVREDAWNSGKKEGQLVHFDDEGNAVEGWVSGSERKIAWQLYLNYQKQDLGTGVVVTDQLAYDGNIDADSIQVSVYDVDSDGETTITDTVLDPANYSVDTDEEGKFILTFADGFEVTERYAVEFTTSVPDISEEAYTNNATVTVDDVDYEYSATLHYNAYDEFLGKRAVSVEGNRVFTGDEVDWQVTVNESLSIIKEAVITDTISGGHIYLEGSLDIYRSQDRENALEEGVDYTLEVVPVTDEDDEPTGETNLVIDIIEDLEDTLILEYTTVVTETDGQISNSISLDGTAINQQSIETGRINARQFSSVGGVWAPNRGAISITKVDAEENELIANNEATFTLWFDLNGERVQYTQVDGDNEVIPFSTEGGVLEIGNLPIRTYYLIEVESPEGYELSDEEVEITVEPFGNNENYYEVEFENTKEKIEVTGTKVWEGGDVVRPDSIDLQLFRDEEALGEPVTLNGSEENPWEYTWTELDRTDIDGNEYDYTVDEVHVPENFEKTISDDGLTITNEYIVEQMDISVNKIWDDADNQDGVRPEFVTVKLLANGEETDQEVILNDVNNWTASFTELPVTTEAGEEINYTVEEDPVNGYETEITGDIENGFVITNKHEPEQIDLEGTKTWEDADNQDGKRPESITVRLLANGEEVADAEVTAGDDWSYSFTDLPKFENGEEINYTIQEDNVEDYSAEINGMNITNSYTPEQTSINVVKGWNDANNQDGIRPEFITIKLLANGEETGQELVLNETNNWQGEFVGLDVYADGEKIEYSVEEVAIEGYEVETTGDADTGFVITNNHEPELIDLEGSKTWDDADNQDGKRPETITVRLLANGAEVDSIEVDSEAEWGYSFTDLPKFENGEEINYTIQEDNVEDYSAEINGMNITNSYTPEQTSINVVKGWNDANNQDGIRPEFITIKLLASGEDTGQELVLNETNNWQGEFVELDVYADGEEIEYSVEEVAIEGYEVETTGDADTGFVITNNHEPELIDLEGSKTWDDADNQDGKRPETITVRLLANGDEVEDIEVSEESDWGYVFTDLPKFENGEEIHYTVQEDQVENYDVEIDGMDITNSYTPEQISIDVVKHWEDADNQDGKRPESITIRLLANGEEVADAEVTAEDDWSYSFTELPKFENGEEINYNIQEDHVEEYSAVIDGMHITNSYTPEQTSINVVKAWEDASNIEARPDSITVKLLANGEETDKEVQLNEANNWQADFTELDVYVNGKEIEYTVEEVEVTGYVTKDIVGNAEDGFVITNNPAKVSVGDYVWIDENKDGLQDETDTPLEGVVLTIEDEDGNPVTDVFGDPVGPQTTDENGYYSFDNLPIDKTYTVKIDREASKEALEGLEPTLEEEGDDNSLDSSTWEATSRHLVEDGERDPTLDFGFIRPSVSVGDYVWIDENKDGLQDETDTPLEGVVLTIEDEDGNPVTDVFGNPVGPTTTDKNGYYIFENLPINKTYIVRIDSELSAKALEGYLPTLEGASDDRSIDSSTWFAVSTHLTVDGQHDPTLDFGFVKEEEPELGGEEESEDPGKPTDLDGAGGETSDPEDPADLESVGGEGDDLPATATNIYNLSLIGFGLMLLGVILFLVRRKRIE